MLGRLGRALSAVMAMEITLVVSPGWNTTVPLDAVKSAAEAASAATV